LAKSNAQRQSAWQQRRKAEFERLRAENAALRAEIERLRNPAPSPAPADADQKRMLAALAADVAGLQWTFAKTVPETPHFYIVRGKTAPETIFVRLFTAIQSHGIVQTYGAFRNKYLYLDDGFKYWCQPRDRDKDVRYARLLNRNDVLNPADWPSG
jgi:hypothetical protein